MTAGRPPSLAEAQRKAIRDMREAHPKMSYEAIGLALGITRGLVNSVFNPRKPIEKAHRRLERPKRSISLPSCSIKKPESILSPIPLSRLMAGR